MRVNLFDLPTVFEVEILAYVQLTNLEGQLTEKAYRLIMRRNSYQMHTPF